MHVFTEIKQNKKKIIKEVHQTGERHIISVLLKTSNFALGHRSESVVCFSFGLVFAVLMSLRGRQRPSVQRWVARPSTRERDGGGEDCQAITSTKITNSKAQAPRNRLRVPAEESSGAVRNACQDLLSFRLLHLVKSCTAVQLKNMK